MTAPWPNNPDCYVTAAQIAAKLGYRTMKAFYAARGALADRGFPEPALPRRWRASQIERWEAWNAQRASAGLPLTPANDALALPPPGPASPASPSLSPAAQRIAELRRAARIAS